MLLSTSPDQDTAAPAPDAARGRRAVSDRARRAVFAGGIVVTSVLLLFGAWQRRWIADDGLIVLRTVRNLLAGNGPVFNAGERVEANTSTVWTYLVYAVAWLTNARLEYIALTLALLLSVGAIVFAMLGSGRLWGGAASGLLLPAGAIVYIAVPPARDYATSGLESALVMCWLGLLWWLLMRWAQATGASEATGDDTGASERWDQTVEVRPGLLTLGFVAGLGVLVRPELLMVSLLALALVFFAPMPRREGAASAAGVRLGCRPGGLPDLADGLLRACRIPTRRWPRTPPAPSGARGSPTCGTSSARTCCGCRC